MRTCAALRIRDIKQVYKCKSAKNAIQSQSKNKKKTKQTRSNVDLNPRYQNGQNKYNKCNLTMVLDHSLITEMQIMTT